MHAQTVFIGKPFTKTAQFSISVKTIHCYMLYFITVFT